MAKLIRPPAEAMNTIRFDSERVMMDQILANPAMADLARTIHHAQETDARRRHLLANSLRITPNIMPQIYKAISFAQRVCGLADQHVEVFVHDDPQLNAACVDFENQGIFLILSSGIIEKLSQRELLSVIGHEFGHAAYRHLQLPVKGMLAQRGKVPPDWALSMLSWQRRAEISADRAGLLCCQDVHVASMALIKISSGLTDTHIQFHLEDYVQQMEDIQSLNHSTQDVEDCFSTHPFNPLRVVALHNFWESQLLTNMLGISPAHFTNEQMDNNINSLLSFMEPESIENTGTPASECLLWGGFWVAVADREIDSREVMSIFHMVNPTRGKQAHDQIKRASNPITFIQNNFKKAAKQARNLSPGEKHALVQKLVVVARADQVVKPEEIQVLKQICHMLKVNPAFIDQILTMTGMSYTA